ncbi:MAG TPA: peptidase M28 family protein, partial [Xanthomonadaceae bacterium]|nr:peptidase M28 family protein [Xanthomonadaceae bacterium]
MRLASLLLALFVASPALAQTPGQTTIPDAALQAASQLREQALADDTAWKVTESLTTEIGPRLAGSEADARAVEWARRKFEALGYDKVWTQPVTFPKWERRSEHGEVLGAYAQPLILAALGGSPGGTV